MSARRILVTGAAGFIGSHISEALLERGDEVLGVDNFDDFYDPALKRANVDLLSRYDGFSLVEADIRDAKAMRDAARTCTVAVHLAARAGVRASLADPVT
ncbi:MAG: NAD-dependent epimerase/dehydratase family protein, partial [Planctomycetota bacterium]